MTRRCPFNFRPVKGSGRCKSAFFKTLSEAAAAKDPAETAADTLHLAVLTTKDWRRLFSTPYGWGLARRSEGKVSLALPAAYPPRLIARWDAVRLRAGQQGVRAPGGVGAYLDALLGLEWAHALLLTRQQGRAPRPWLREVAAAHLYQAVLSQLRDTQRLEYLSAGRRCKEQELQLKSGRVIPKHLLIHGLKQPFDALLWAQSTLCYGPLSWVKRTAGRLQRRAVGNSCKLKPKLRLPVR